MKYKKTIYDTIYIMDNEERQAIPRRVYLIGPILAVQWFTYMGSFLILQQYAYYIVHKTKFPDLNSTENEFTCATNTSTDEYKLQVQIQQETSNWILYVSIASGIPSVFISFLFTSYSDRFGRKPFIVIATAGLFLKISLCTIGIYLEWDLMLFIVFFTIEGIVGAQMVPMSISFSMIADVTKPGKTRSFAIALVDMSVGVGLLLGTLLSGYLIEALGYGPPIAIYSAMLLITLFLALFGIPETVNINYSAESVPLSKNIKDALSFYVDPKAEGEGKRLLYILYMLIFLFVMMSTIGKTQIDTLYELNSPFCWDAVRIGIFAMARNAGQFLIGIPSIKLLQKCLSDEYVTLVGLISNTFSLILEGTAPNSMALYFVALVGAGSMIPVPLIKGLMSRITTADKQGALFAGIGSVAASCNVLGAVFANGIYTATVSIYRGLVYLIMAACCVVAMIFLLVLKHGIKQTDINPETTDENSKKIMDLRSPKCDKQTDNSSIRTDENLQKSNGPRITKM